MPPREGKVVETEQEVDAEDHDYDDSKIYPPPGILCKCGVLVGLYSKSKRETLGHTVERRSPPPEYSWKEMEKWAKYMDRVMKKHRRAERKGRAMKGCPDCKLPRRSTRVVGG